MSVGSAAVDEINIQKQRSTVTLEDPDPRYAPVNPLTHALSLPQLATDWCRHHSNVAASGGEEPIYSSPYQHLSLDNLDYTNMYSKPHQHTEVTVRKSALPHNPGL